MARAHVREPILDTLTGRPINGAVVTVREQGTTNAIAAVMYDAKSGGSVVSNPITTGPDGTVEFWLNARQQIDFAVEAAGYTTPGNPIVIDDVPVIADQTDLADKSSPETWTNKTMTSPVLNTPQLNSPTITGQVLLAAGTRSAPGWGFATDTDNGAYLEGSNAWNDSVGGRDVLRRRVAPSGYYPQVAFGQTDEAGGWVWTDNVSAVKIHLIQTTANRGSILGLHSVIRNEANLTGAYPDSSAVTGVAYQTDAGADGMLRAVEAQIIRSGGGADANALAHAHEIGCHFSVAGNGAWKTGGIHLHSTENGWLSPGTGVPADVGLWIRGVLGFINPLKVTDETATALGDVFNVDGAGRVIAGSSGTASSTTYGYAGNAGLGEYRVAADVLGWATGSTLRMRLDSTGLGVGGTAPAGSRLYATGGLVEAAGGIKNGGVELRTAVSTPTQLTANTDNWNPTNLATSRVIRFSTDVSRNITGLVAQPAGTVIELFNVGSADGVFLHETTSTAANRFNTPGGAALTVPASGSAVAWYDGTSQRWRIR
jgi:hypothetical protein